jgi:hypothetical protein
MAASFNMITSASGALVDHNTSFYLVILLGIVPRIQHWAHPSGRFAFEKYSG